MRTRCLLSLALLIGFTRLGAGPASAAEEIYLTWLECPLGNAPHHITSPCNSNFGSNDLYASFRLPFPIDSVLGVELVVDLQHSSGSLPDWWRFDPGTCRAGELVADFDFSVGLFCVDFWLETPAGGLIDYTVGQPRGLPSQARIRVAGSLTSDNMRQLNDTDMYYAARVRVQNGKTVAPQAICTGCSFAACAVLNSILVRRLPGAPGGDVTLSTPGPMNANFATWQGTTADCFLVPVKATSWGRIKGLYR